MSEPMQQPGLQVEQSPDQRLMKIKSELSASGIRGLVGRIERGLDPMSMLVVSETAQALEPMLNAAHIDKEKLYQLTQDLHFGGIWQHAQELASASAPEMKVWMFLAQITHEVNDRDLSTEEFLADVDRIKEDFAAAAHDSETVLTTATEKMRRQADQAFTKEDGVAVAKSDAFMFMAMKGETAGVVVAGELIFVGANELDYETVATDHGLRREVRQDPRRGNIDTTFYVGDNSVEVKVLGKGFCIVFGGDRELAKALARTGQQHSS